MVLVFILCTAIILFSLLICMTILSTIRLQINHFTMSNIEQSKQDFSKQDNDKLKNNKAAPSYKVKLSFYLFNKIKWFSIRLNDKKMRKMYTKMQLEKIDLKKLEKDFKFENLKQIKAIKPQISYLHLDVQMGTENAIVTSFIVFAISTLISVILPHTIKKYEKDKYYYQIVPVYINKNVYKIKFDCIIEIKMVHIINIVYFLSSRKLREQLT